MVQVCQEGTIILCPFKAADFLLNLSEDSQIRTLEAYFYQRIEIKGSDWLFNKEEIDSCKFLWKEERVKLREVLIKGLQ